MNNFFTGVSYLNEGFKLITRTGVRRFVIMPVCINMIVFVGLFFVLRHYMYELNNWILTLLPSWLQWLHILFWIIFVLGFLFFFIYAFVAIGNIISAPFNSLLSEKIETVLTNRVPESRSFLENLKDTPRVIGRQLSIISYYSLRAIVLLLLLFVPIIHTIVPILWFLFSAWFMTMTYLDYPTDNHRISVSALRVWLKERYWSAFGFGCSVVFVSMVPILNFFVIAAAVAGGTKFWVEEK